MNLCPQPKSIILAEGHYEGAGEVCYLQDPKLANEAYRIRIEKDAIVLESGSAAGQFYAEQTLLQLRKCCSSGLPILRISDEPDLSVRGYMLDVSRGKIPKMETLFRWIDVLAHFKYNQLQLYFENVFQYVGHEQAWQTVPAFSSEEIERLDRYCQTRFIELVPNQNSLGHMERWLCNRAYHSLAECPDGFIHPLTGEKKPCGSTLCVNKESLTFLDGLYEQLLPHFSSKQFNVGCDEPWEFALGKSRGKADELGASELYCAWLKELSLLAKKHGKQIQFWADFILKYPESIDCIPAKSKPVIWGYEADHPFSRECSLLRNASIPFLVAAGDSTWNSFSGRFHTMCENVKNAVAAAKAFGAEGIFMTHWGDAGHPQMWPVQLPGAIFAGGHAWNASQKTDLAKVIDQFILEDEAQRAGRVILELGRIDDCLPVRRHNRSVLFDLFLSDKKPHFPGIDEIRDTHFQAVLDRLNAIEEDVGNMKLACRDSHWIKDELQLTLNFLRWTIKHAQSNYRGRKDAQLKAQLDRMVKKSRDVRNRRNRKA